MLKGIGTALSGLAGSINETAKSHRGTAAIIIDLGAIYFMYTTRKPMVFCSAAGALVGNTIAWIKDATFTKQMLSTAGGASVCALGSYFFPAQAAKVHQAVAGFFGLPSAASTETSTDAVGGEDKGSAVTSENVKEEVAPAPVDDKVAPAPVNEEVAPAPVNKEVASAPVNEEVASAPVNEEVASAPVNKEVASAPVNEEVASAPVNEEVASAPVNKEVAPAPVNEEVASAPVNETRTYERVGFEADDLDE